MFIGENRMIAPRNNGKEKKRKKASLNVTRIIVWGGLTLAVVAIALILLRPSDEQEEQQTTDKKNGLIKETAPALTMRPEKTQQEIEAEEEAKKKPLPPQRVGELRDGYRLLPDGTLHRVLGIVTNTPPKMSLADKTFTHSADGLLRPHCSLVFSQ